MRISSGRNKHLRPVVIRGWRLCARKALLLVCLPALALAACLPEPATTVPPTLTPTVTVTPTTTATIVWFPPTATYTPRPTAMVEPTQDTRPAVGEVIFRDAFTGKEDWSAASTAVGSISNGDGELTLAVRAAKGSLISLRERPQLADFYLEIDVLPSLCRENDAFGLLLRAGAGGDYYRLLMNCAAQLRVERLKNSRATVIQDWVISGQIPPGGLMRVRLGVWLAGSDMRIFVNDVYQFTVRDTLYKTGTLGVFARSAGDTPLTVNFSNLVVYSVDGLRVPTPAPTPAPTLSPTATRQPTATASR